MYRAHPYDPEACVYYYYYFFFFFFSLAIHDLVFLVLWLDFVWDLLLSKYIYLGKVGYVELRRLKPKYPIKLYFNSFRRSY